MIGDSISSGMLRSGRLFQMLRDVTQSAENPGNADNTNLGAHCVSSWLRSPSCPVDWDVVSFNFGLHDIAGDQERLTLTEYEGFMRQIASTLQRETRAKLLFVTTTPVPVDPHNASRTVTSPARLNSDVEAFNRVARQVMSDHGIEVLDMYAFVVGHCGAGYSECDWQRRHNVHFQDEGYRKMAAHLAQKISSLVPRESAGLWV